VQALGPLPPPWEERARAAEGACLRAAGVAALAEKDYEKALEFHTTAARLLGLNETEVRSQVIGAMFGEAYHLIADPAANEAAQHFLARILILQSPCPEASFWLGLCQVRAGRPDLALEALRTAHEGARHVIDPPLYVGILLRGSQPTEALRYLAEANRIDAGCPFVAWQLGSAIQAAGGDAGLAVRALQKALGPRGLPQWVRAPEKAWQEGFPSPERSYVARLAARQRFACPLLGGDVGVMVRQAFFTLSQAQHRLGNHAEAAAICTNLLRDAAPTVPLLRGGGARGRQPGEGPGRRPRPPLRRVLSARPGEGAAAHPGLRTAAGPRTGRQREAGVGRPRTEGGRAVPEKERLRRAAR
jgi:tetratricopeptide (TPR) repeat protein